MNRYTTYLLAASIALSGATLFAADTTGMNTGANSAAAQMGNGAVRSGNELQAIGNQQADATTSREVRNSLAQVVNDALTPNRFSDLSNHLAKPDQKRFSDVSTMKTDDLNRAVNQFRQDFRSKYGQDFDARDTAFQDALIYSGQDKNSATVALHDISMGNAMHQSSAYSSNSTNKPADQMSTSSDVSHSAVGANNTMANNGAAIPPGDRTNTNDLSSATLGNRTGPESRGTNSNTTVRGSDINAGVATGSNTNTNSSMRQDLASSTTTPPAGSSLTLNLVNENNSWKIDLPDQISAQQLKDNLARHIQTLDDQKSTWPSDVNQAYRSTAYHVLRAFNDTAMASER